jgi:hypothetical protein
MGCANSGAAPESLMHRACFGGKRARRVAWHCDVYDVWDADPLFYPAIPPAHWLMVAEVAGAVLVVPLAPPDSNDATRCRPIGCYVASTRLADQYRRDR